MPPRSEGRWDLRRLDALADLIRGAAPAISARPSASSPLTPEDFDAAVAAVAATPPAAPRALMTTPRSITRARIARDRCYARADALREARSRTPRWKWRVRRQLAEFGDIAEAEGDAMASTFGRGDALEHAR